MGLINRFFYTLSLFFHWPTGFVPVRSGLHTARFARPTELQPLAGSRPGPSLLLGTGSFGQLLHGVIAGVH
jgi:hypothetical protein